MSYESNDDNYVSVGGWMLMMLVTAIPIIGLIMIFVLAFAGENQTRKNYFRAILMWFGIAVGLISLAAFLGHLPGLQKFIHDFSHKP